MDLPCFEVGRICNDALFDDRAYQGMHAVKVFRMQALKGLLP